jgi:hypothetical protein
MADQKIRMTVRDWATECAIAEAGEVLDSPFRGIIAVENAQSPVVYEFSNGRRFRDSKKKPGVD